MFHLYLLTNEYMSVNRLEIAGASGKANFSAYIYIRMYIYIYMYTHTRVSFSLGGARCATGATLSRPHIVSLSSAHFCNISLAPAAAASVLTPRVKVVPHGALFTVG